VWQRAGRCGWFTGHVTGSRAYGRRPSGRFRPGIDGITRLGGSLLGGWPLASRPGPARWLRPGAGHWPSRIGVTGRDGEGSSTGKRRAAGLGRACRRHRADRRRTIRSLADAWRGRLGRCAAAGRRALASPAGMCPGIPTRPGRTVLGRWALLARGGPGIPGWLAVGRGGLRRPGRGRIRRARPARCRRARPRPGLAIAGGGRRGARQVSRAGEAGLADPDGGHIGDRARRLGGRNRFPEDRRTLPHDPGCQQERRQCAKADGDVDNRQVASDNPRDKHCDRHGNEGGAYLDHSRPPRARLSHPRANACRAQALRRGGSRQCDRWARTARHRHQ
jgi:hypothetical protein